MPAEPGTACWAELDVDDPEAVLPFYAAVLGWSYDPSDGAGVVARRDGIAVAALGVAGVATPPAWTVHLAADDVDAAAERCEELGGQLLHGPEDDERGARVLLALDAGGAVVGLRESDDEVPAPAPGMLVGAEAASAEPGTTRTFHGALLGYRFGATSDGAPDHTACLGAGGEPLARIGFAGDALPHWLPVFAVADVDAAVAAAQEAGGTVVAPASAARPATLADPAGAPFGVTVRR